MARISPLSQGLAEPHAGEHLARLSANRGYVPNLYATLAHSPGLLHEFIATVEATRTSLALSSLLRELAILAIARRTGATIQWLSHLPIARGEGASAEQLASLGAWESSGAFSAEERAVLRFADEVARDGSASDETFAAVAAFLDARQVVELTFVAAFYNAVSRILKTLQVDTDVSYLGPAADAFRP